MESEDLELFPLLEFIEPNEDELFPLIELIEFMSLAFAFVSFSPSILSQWIGFGLSSSS